MKTTPTTGQSAQDLNKPATLAEAHQRIHELGEALRETDCYNQTMVGGIETVARLALKAMQAPSSHAHGNADLPLTEALDLIAYLAADAQNSIGVTAERMGCHFSDEAAALRSAARYEARQTARTGGAA